MPIDVKSIYNNSRGADIRQAEQLRRIPPRKTSVCEIISYAVLPFILIMAGAMPSAALFLFAVILPMLYLLYRRFGLYFPIACVLGYGGIALWLNYDILTVIYFVALLFAFCGLVFSAQLNAYLACAAAAAIFACIGAFAGVITVRFCVGEPLGDIAAHYVVEERDDPVIGYLSREYYDGITPADGEQKLKPSDDGYALAAASSYAEWAKDEFGLYTWYYCLHYASVFSAIGFLVSVVINRRTASCYDSGATKEQLVLSTRALGGVRVMLTPLAQMKMPRAYLWTCLLPAALTGMVLWFVGGYDVISATIMHAFATLPSAFTFFTLLTFFASLFRGKARVAAHIVLIIIGIAMVLLPIVLFICSMIGVCDCILNLRFWTRYIMEG